MRYRTQPIEDDEEEVLDISIIGDEEEQHRIELEHNLQDLSIQLSLSNPSSASDAGAADPPRPPYAGASDSSFELEQARHNPHPRDISIFDGQASIYPFGSGQNRDYSFNHFSQHSFDDEDAAPYLGHTKSSMAHHASAVTLSAGLRPQRHRSPYGGDASLSGAEYDPDRPLDNVLNGMANDLSMLNMDTPRAQRKHKPTHRMMAPSHTELIHAVEDGDGETSRGFTKPQLSAQPNHITALHGNLPPTHRVQPIQKRTMHQEHIPTPSTANGTGGSKFTKLAKSLAKEIEASQRWVSEAAFEPSSPGKRKASRQQQKRNPLHDVANHRHVPSSRQNRDRTRTVSNPIETVGRHRNARPSTHRSNARDIALPDVTGLTSAIASPVKPATERRPYLGGHEGEEVEEQLLHTLTGLQTRLNQLESQNLVSRRRVRELELELEACKAEVKRERTRVLEREQIIVAQQKDFQKRRAASKRPDRVEELAMDDRYNEAVEEKKALEALIGTLRSHLARLTEELSSQQEQLDDLRSMRETDIQDLREKIMEVDSLKLEVERLGGEVEILRGVVEEGLKERRRVKEDIEAENDSISYAPNLPDANEPVARQPRGAPAELDDLTYEPSRIEIPSPPPSRPQTPQQVNTRTAQRLIDQNDFEKVSAELEEQRFERSLGHSRDHSVESIQVDDRTTKRKGRVGTKSSLKQEGGKVRTNARARIIDDSSPKQARVYAKTPARAPVKKDVEEETPFPQIRGTRLERLFFSAPEHNEKTCRVCHRRRRPGELDDELDFPSWLPPRKRAKLNADEGQSRLQANKVSVASASRAPFAEDRLPPQTVLVRVLRELEDDFTHYKGIYGELADQYKVIDAASNVAKRNVLAEHLREVIDTLEQKGDQIASLYDLLAFKDKPSDEPAVTQRNRKSHVAVSPRSNRRPGTRHNALRKYATYS